MERLSCFNCKNHAHFEMKCSIGHKNYISKENLFECFVINDFLKAAEDVVKLVLEYNPDADESLIYQHLKKIKLCHDQ